MGDLPRPVQEDKYLLQTGGNAFIFPDFIKSSVLLNEFIIFYKFIGFTKKMYEYKSLSPNHIFTLKISRLTTFIFLLIILWFFIKIISFLTKIEPIRALMGP